MANFATYEDGELSRLTRNFTVHDWRVMRDDEYWEKYDSLHKFKTALLNFRLKTVKEYIKNK